MHEVTFISSLKASREFLQYEDNPANFRGRAELVSWDHAFAARYLLRADDVAVGEKYDSTRIYSRGEHGALLKHNLHRHICNRPSTSKNPGYKGPGQHAGMSQYGLEKIMASTGILSAAGESEEGFISTMGSSLVDATAGRGSQPLSFWWKQEWQIISEL